MNEETNPDAGQGTGTPIEQIPTDFRAFERWRRTGELPANEGEKPAVPATAQVSDPNGEPEAQVTTAPDSEPDVPDTATTAGDEKRPGSRERKIDRLIRENSELLRRIESLEQTGSAAGAAYTSQPPPIPEEPTGKPDLNNFKTLEEYTEALTEWKIDQREARHREQEHQRAIEAATKAMQDSWAAKEKAAIKAHPDYADLRDATPVPNGPGVMAIRQALLEDDNGAEILYWLAQRPTELKRIAELNPAKAVLEVGKLSASLASNPVSEPHKSKVTSAPKPPSPISHGTVRTHKNVYDEDFARSDYKAWEKQRVSDLKG